MNSKYLIRDCIKNFNKIGIYGVRLYNSIINIHINYNYSKCISTIFLRFIFQNKKYIFNIDLACDYDCDKSIITIFYRMYKNKMLYGYINNNKDIVATSSQIRKVICTIVKDVFYAMNNLLSTYNEKTTIYVYHYLEHNYRNNFESYSNYILCLACRNILEIPYINVNFKK